jgi:hypothetical protein
MKAQSLQLIICLTILIFSSCGCRPNEQTIPTKKHNYVIVLDLSDRLLNNGQAEKDSSIIMTAFTEFEKTARSPLILTSKDRFVVRIIPQKGSGLRKDYFENKLNIDLSTLDAAHKNNAFVELKGNICSIVSELYKEAHLGNNSTDYFGIDIWKFFNDEINTELKTDAENKVVVLTDGYFDFNDNSHVIKDGNTYTSTSFLNELKSKDWQQKAEQGRYGLIPVNLKTKAQLVIAGIQPKDNDILMAKKLSHFWSKWLVESGATKPKIILDNSISVMVQHYCR